MSSTINLHDKTTPGLLVCDEYQINKVLKLYINSNEHLAEGFGPTTSIAYRNQRIIKNLLRKRLVTGL